MAECFEKLPLLVSGYLRDFETHNKLFTPMELSTLIVAFYPRIKFYFMDKGNNEHIISITDDGCTVICGEHVSGGWVTLQIGDFFTNKDKLMHTLTLKFSIEENTHSFQGYNSIGFISNEFTLFESPTWNPGRNGSVSISSNGYFVTSECFDKELNHHSSVLAMTYTKDDAIMIKIDTHKMKAIIWNSTPSDAAAMKDMDVDGEYPDYQDHYLKFDLPKDIPVALSVELGKPHVVKLLRHEITYLTHENN
eukprot:106598_1